jgi:hypothetical protein
VNITPVQLAERVEAWQKMLTSLAIGHYRITQVTLTDQVPDGLHSTSGMAEAAVGISNNYDDVHFSFNSEFVEDATEQELDEAIVHEWIHVGWRDLDRALSDTEKWMPEATADAWSENIHHIREGIVDRTARQLYAFHRAPKGKLVR